MSSLLPLPTQPSPRLNTLELSSLLWTACATFVAFYGPQPLLPSIQEYFRVSNQQVSLLLTLTIAPLGFAPLLYGKILGARSGKTLLRIALPLCVCSLIVPVYAESFSLMLLARTIQGLTIPAIALSLMTCISARTEACNVQRAMSLYATATMVGAYGGRMLAGFVAAQWGWRTAFAVLAVMMCTSAIPMLRMRDAGEARFTPLHWLALRQVVRQPGFLPILCIGPLCIFAYASVLNLIPFRVRELDTTASEGVIGFMYIAAFACASLGAFSHVVLRVLGGEMRAVRTGILCFMVATPLLLIDSMLVFLGAALAFGIGFALVYTTMPGIVNQISVSGKNITNGVYLSLYYTGSALGTWGLILLYSETSMPVYVATLLCIFVLALWCSCSSATLSSTHR